MSLSSFVFLLLRSWQVSLCPRREGRRRISSKRKGKEKKKKKGKEKKKEEVFEGGQGGEDGDRPRPRPRRPPRSDLGHPRCRLEAPKGAAGPAGSKTRVSPRRCWQRRRGRSRRRRRRSWPSRSRPQCSCLRDSGFCVIVAS